MKTEKVRRRQDEDEQSEMVLTSKGPVLVNEIKV